MKKALVSLMFLCAALLLTAPLSARAETSGDFEYSINSNGSCTITGYNGEGGNLEIPAMLDGRSVTAIGDSAFRYNRSITSVVIPDGVTSVGEYAFYSCSKMTAAEIPDSVTEIHDSAFRECYGLTSILLPDGVTSIGEYAFYGCYNLTEINIPDNVTSLEEGVLGWCSSLQEISIPAAVTSIDPEAFSSCSSLTGIHVDEGNAAYCSIDGVLYDMSVETLLVCPGGFEGVCSIPTGVKEIGQEAFYYCKKLTNAVIPYSVNRIGKRAFSGSGVTTLVIPNSITDFGELEKNCFPIAAT